MTDKIKITIIYDNSLALSGLKHGFGFSCLLEFNNKYIIFDTGGDKKAFFENVEKLGIKLDSVTHIIFSHQHWDHTAGFTQVIEKLNSSCQIYVPFKFDDKLLAQVSDEKHLNLIKGIVEIEEHIFLMVLKGRSCVVKECFSVYEQSLIINRTTGAVILTGCAHPGIKNILNAVKNNFKIGIDWVIGGFHLHRSFNKTIKDVVQEFNSLNVKNVAPCHCTGKKAIEFFRTALVHNIHDIGSGSVLYV